MDGQSWPNPLTGHCPEISRSHKAVSKVSLVIAALTCHMLMNNRRWERAHYYLGKHYNKILESEKAKPMGKEAQI